jgi:predicted MFS family arabinose efflux permease
MTPPRRAVTAIFALNGGLFGAWAARIPAFVDRFDVTSDILGLLLLCIAGGAILAFPLAGRLVERIGAAALSRRLVPSLAIVFVALPLAPHPLVLAIFLGLFGAAYGAMDVAMNGWAAEVERAAGRPIMSSFHAAYSLAAGVGAATGILAVAAGLSPLWHFAVLAAPCTAATAALARVTWISRIGQSGPAFAWPRGALVLVGLVAFASAVGEGAMVDWSAVYLTQVTGTTEALAPLGFATFSVAMVAARLVADRVVARIGPVATARASGLAAAAGIAVLIAAPTLALAMPGFLLLGIGYAAIFPLAFSRAAADPEMAPGPALAATATLAYGGALVGPPIIGWTAALSSLPVAMALVGLAALAITLLAGSLRAP